MGSQVALMLASPDTEVKSQLLSLKAPSKIWLTVIEDGSSLSYAKAFVRLVLRVGSSFLLD